MNWKRDFPALYGKNIVYCDNAATTHKPQSVIDAVTEFYRDNYAPIYRGVYTSAERATQLYEDVRRDVADFIGATAPHEIVFTKSATEGVNIVAWSWAWHVLTQDDEIVITDLDHHANIVTWQRFAQLKKCALRRIPLTEDGDIDYHAAASVITSATKLVAISSHSNVVGVPVNTHYITRIAHHNGAYVVCDASQQAPRARLDMYNAEYDFCVFSPHKMLGPTGLGVLYAASRHHTDIAPYVYGGGMVHRVTPSEHVWREMPYRCEAGSPPSAQVIGFGAAISYLRDVSLSALRDHEASLCHAVLREVRNIPGLHVVGPEHRIAQDGHMVSLYHDSIDAQDIALYCDTWNICVRSGHHCAQPLHIALGVRNTVRISWYGYNTFDDVEQVTLALRQLLA